MAGKVKTWVWVVVAIVGLGILGIIAMAAASMYYFSKHVQMREASPAVAARSFDEVKARFATQKPLIELDDDGDFMRSNLDRERPAHPAGLGAMHVMVYDPDDGKVFTFSIPWWLVRLQKGERAINFNGRDMDLEHLKITVEDLERLGPTLIVDHKSRGGERVLVWSQ